MTKDGQCTYLAVEGSRFCEYHSGEARGGKRHEQAKSERYLIDNQALREAYQRQQDDKDYLDLKDEILLLTALMERRINSAKTDVDLQLATNHAVALMQRLESMKINLLKIQQQLGLVLGKDQLRVLAREMAVILDEELDGLEDKDERMEAISERLFVAIEQAGRKLEDE